MTAIDRTQAVMPTLAPTRLAVCSACPVGKASGVGHGGQCPMVDRPREAGTWIYGEGDAIDRIFFVKKGSVVLSREANDRGERVVAWAVRHAGSVLGIEGLVRATYLDSARAVTDVVLCSAPIERIRCWLADQRPAARALLDLVLQAQSFDSPRRSGAEGNATQRVARWLLDDGATGIDPSLPRGVIAELLGMLPETFSRALSSLRALGAIETTRRSLCVVNPAILQEITGAAPSKQA
jgi:CRP-like cAMP-binding protein